MSSDAPAPTGMDRPRKRSFLDRHRRALFAAGVLAIMAIGAGVVLNRASQRSLRVSAATLTIATVERGVYHDNIPLTGNLAAHDTILLTALEGGRVERVLARAGDDVSKGQALVELSNSTLSLDVLEREARLIESLTQLQAYQTSLEQNRLANEKTLADIDYNFGRLQRSLQRRETLAATGAEPRELKDQVSDEFAYYEKTRALQIQGNANQDALRRRQLPQIQAQADKLQKDVVITRGMLDNLVVRAPADGKLTALSAEIGETRARGESFGEITLNTGFKLIANVDEYYLGRLHMGQLAQVLIEGKAYRLHITRIYPQVSKGTFRVDLDFIDPPPSGVVPGQTLQGKLTLGADIATLVLQNGAFMEGSGGDWVFVVDEDGRTAVRRRIKVGRRNSDQVEILSGLRPGDKVIVSDYSGFGRTERVDLDK